MSNIDSTKAYVCPGCSAENRENAKFCRQCGGARKMDFATPTLEVIVCQTCTTEIRASDLFCLSCGAKQGPRAPKEKNCPSCSKQLPPAANFCTGCGTKVEETAVVTPRAAVYPNLEA